MKRLLTGISILTMLVMIGVAPHIVQAAPTVTRVTGVIAHNNEPMADAEVTVMCGGATETDVTDQGGSYLVAFAAADCPLGSVTHINAKKGSLSGSASGDVQGVTTRLNTAVVNASLPEYGLIGGILAAGVGIGLVAFTRRRHGQQQANV